MLHDPVPAKLGDRIRVIADAAEHKSVCSPSVGGRVTISPGVSDSRTATRAVGAGFGRPG